MDIVSTIMNQLMNQDSLDPIAKKTQVNTTEVQKVAQMGLPMIMEGLNQRTNQDEKVSAELASSVSKHSDDDTDHLSNFFQQAEEREGNQLLDMAFGSNEQEVESRLSQKTGVESPKVKSILAMLAPLALSMLAKRSGSSNQMTGSGVSDLLGDLSGSVRKQSPSSDIGDILSSVLGGSTKKPSSQSNNALDNAKDALGSIFDKE
ncbi:DUF937 domain-containing protein [Lacticigenium naphthae]|uniref:DUF937 domain-containing protein n=1 Tax=Lacticigenium naphthae TaxID=515351 RepID=UPI000411A396|nr:DUF937 domain-containing protein [Lacticigenium naphthae]